MADLSERVAKCPYCGTTTASREELPFFEYRGEGSREATDHCANCRYHKVAHTGERHPHICGDFQPRGPAYFDFYYCGCRGWD